MSSLRKGWVNLGFFFFWKYSLNFPSTHVHSQHFPWPPLPFSLVFFWSKLLKNSDCERHHIKIQYEFSKKNSIEPLLIPPPPNPSLLLSQPSMPSLLVLPLSFGVPFSMTSTPASASHLDYSVLISCQQDNTFSTIEVIIWYEIVSLKL